MTFTTRSKAPQGKAVSGGRRWRLGATVAALLLAACGGGTSQFEPFVAQRVLVVGDELSAIESDGRKYGINGLVANSETLDCSAEPNWVQSVAAYYGLVFKECNPTNTTTLNAITRAAAGAKVADIAAQVEAQVAAGGFRDKDLALVLGGMNDILELYGRFQTGAQSLASLQGEAQARGERMAAVVNRLVDLQAKVIVSTVPDLGLSPFAVAEEANKAGSAFALSELTRVFNERLGVRVLLDGRFVGLMQTDLRTQLANRFPGGFGLSDASSAACNVTLPETALPNSSLRRCTTGTLVTGASSGAFFWAYGTQLSTGGQSQLASLAVDRARLNPF